MAIDAKVSFIDQMKEKLADVLTVEQMAKLEKTGYELLDGFDMSETIHDDGPDDLLDSYVSAMQVECRSQKTIDREGVRACMRAGPGGWAEGCGGLGALPPGSRTDSDQSVSPAATS